MYYMASKTKKFKLSPRTIISIITIILVCVVIFENHETIRQAITHLADTNIFVLLLLIPEQLFMYYCCGQVFFSFLTAKKNVKKVSQFDLMRISLELNFVNHAVPAGGFGGLAYITWRLRGFGVTAGQSSFIYALRYVITICANQFQTIIAVIFLLAFSAIPANGMWIVWLTALISVSVVALIVFLIVVTSSLKRIHKMTDIAVKICDWGVKTFTLGRKTNKLKREIIEKYLVDIHEDLLTARRNKRLLIRPILWGIVYSFLEVAIYWIVAISRGQPGVLPQILIGEAIGSALGVLFPIGPYEVGMVGVMGILGVEDALSIVCIARVVVLSMTIATGYGFYQNAISKIGKKEREALEKETGGV